MFEKISRIVIKLLFLIFFVLLLIYLFHEAGRIGFSVFADKAYDSSETAVESVITVTEGEALLDIAKDLEKTGIVKNAYVTAMAFRTMEGYDQIRPGEYILKASMKPSKIMDMLTRKEEKQQ